MSLLDPRLARRIDRLARRAHRHHRFSHHPLCPAYAPDRLRVGRYHLCRGCASAAAGALIGLGVGISIVPELTLTALGTLAVIGALGGIAALRFRSPNLGKLTTRALPGAVAGFVLAQGVRRTDAGGLSIAAVTLLLTALGVLLYRRRGPSRTPCATCPERDLAPCAGHRPIYDRERAFQRLAGRWIAGEARPNPARAHRAERRFFGQARSP